MFSEQPWPLHGFAETDDGWIGISRDRYFRNRNGNVTEHAMPMFQGWSGIQISAESENVLFVVSSCCWGTEAGELYSTIAIPVRP